MAPAQASLLTKLDTQERVRDFLTNAVASGRASHAYLFLGAPGAGKLDAAWALAQAFLCEQDGCGSCDSCVRVARHTHPDVHYYTPESATGYLIAQTRELLDDVPLAPIRAKAKVYIIDRAEQLRANTANALLKTLEEPPDGVMFILLGTSADVMLPTIVSRCQCVPFRLVSPAVAAQAVSRATGQDPARCRMAVAVAGSPTRGIEFLKSAERQDARRQMVRAIDSLIAADEADVLSRAKSLIVAVKAPLAEVKSTQEKVLEQNADYLSRGALKQLEDRNKRELNARERSGIMEALASARTLMRDVLLTLQFLISESVRGEGAVLLNGKGERFTDELQPRDVVAAAIFNEMEKENSNHVWLSLAPIDEAVIQNHFPNIYEHCLEEGYDVTKEPIPVVPAQHYFMGGVKVNMKSKTTMNNLYAAGETSCNGVHGANRLASNSLLESLVFAKRAVNDMDFDNTSQCPDFIIDNINTSLYTNKEEIAANYRESVLNEIERAKNETNAKKSA